jgi:hypothetical protein
MVWWPWPASDSVPSHISSLDNPKHGGDTTEIFRRRCEAENHRERKALRQAEICRGNSLPEGEIVAIVTAIQLDFIGIIIITISTASTIISIPSRCNIWVVSCLVHRGNFPGVDYSL